MVFHIAWAGKQFARLVPEVATDKKSLAHAALDESEE